MDLNERLELGVFACLDVQICEVTPLSQAAGSKLVLLGETFHLWLFFWCCYSGLLPYLGTHDHPRRVARLCICPGTTSTHLPTHTHFLLSARVAIGN